MHVELTRGNVDHRVLVHLDAREAPHVLERNRHVRHHITRNFQHFQPDHGLHLLREVHESVITHVENG